MENYHLNYGYRINTSHKLLWQNHINFYGKITKSKYVLNGIRTFDMDYRIDMLNRVLRYV